jgi:hypothetical protein
LCQALIILQYLYIFVVLAIIVLNVVGSIVFSCPISTTHLPASTSAVILSFVSDVGTTLGLLAFSFDFTDIGTELIAEIK